jgi:hypothetical protein
MRGRAVVTVKGQMRHDSKVITRSLSRSQDVAGMSWEVRRKSVPMKECIPRKFAKLADRSMVGTGKADAVDWVCESQHATRRNAESCDDIRKRIRQRSEWHCGLDLKAGNGPRKKAVETPTEWTCAWDSRNQRRSTNTVLIQIQGASNTNPAHRDNSTT